MLNASISASPYCQQCAKGFDASYHVFLRFTNEAQEVVFLRELNRPRVY
jgi:hypothetical protein